MGYEKGYAELAPHQQRVVDEKAELDGKLTKLNAFLGGAIYSNLAPDEQERLSRQSHIMQAYSEVLAERIAAF